MKHSRAEVLVGLSAVLLAAGLVWRSAGFVRERYTPTLYTVTAYFEDARGLNTGTPIRLAGIRAGQVLSIAPPEVDAAAPPAGPDFTGLSAAEKRKRVRLVLGIYQDVEIHTHRVRVAAIGLVQERYIAIDVADTPRVPRGAELLGEMDVSLDNVGDAARRAQAIFADPATADRVARFSTEMKVLLDGFGRIVDRGPDVVKRAQASFHAVGEDASAMTASLKDAGGRTKADWEPISADLDRRREQVARIRDHFDAISKDAEELHERLRSGRGTLARVASSAELSASLSGIQGARTKMAFDRRNAKPMSRSTRSILKIAKAVLFFLKPSH